MKISTEALNARDAEERAKNFSSFSARIVVIDGDELIVIVYGNGPTVHLNTVMRAVAAMPLIDVREN